MRSFLLFETKQENDRQILSLLYYKNFIAKELKRYMYISAFIKYRKSREVKRNV